MKDTIEEDIIPHPHKMYAQTLNYGIFPLELVKHPDKITPLSSKSTNPNSRITVKDPLTQRTYYLPKGLNADDAGEIIGFQSGHRLLSATALCSRPPGILFEPTNNPN